MNILCLIAGLWSISLAAVALRQPPRPLPAWLFGAGMTLLAVDTALLMASLATAGLDSILAWERWRVVGASALPAVWLAFSLSYARGNQRESLRQWRLALGVAGTLPMLALAALPWLVTAGAGQPATGLRPEVRLLWPSRVVELSLLVFSVLILMNLERTLRAAVGTMRWRIKLVVMGVSLIFAVRLYTSSQALLYSMSDAAVAGYNGIALCLGCFLITASFSRANLSAVEVYPSLAALQKSLTVLLAGVYLVIVGLLAKLAASLQGNRAFPVVALLVLVSLLALGLVLMSDRVRFLWMRFVSRHFQRPLHDYRAVWRNFNERTGAVADERAYARQLVALLSETLQVLSVTAWLADESRGCLRCVASTALPESGAGSEAEAGVELSQFGGAFAARAEPFALDALDGGTGAWVEELKRLNPEQFRTGGDRVCVPLLGQGQFLGLLMVGDRVNGVALSVEDFELLECLADEAASGLLNLRLSQRLLRAREMEAFQTMAAFFVHDLKNTASSLSLMLQNLPAQMENPAFRQDALRAVFKAVSRLNDLIARLNAVRSRVETRPVEADLDTVVRSALESFGVAPDVKVVRELQPTPKVRVDPEQMQKVMANLLANAREAVGAGGEIRVTTFRNNGWAGVSVRDNGCGISPEFLSRSLFRPFQTTKKNGLGLGMFHCKTIVEAHRGRIEVESEPGSGSTFRVLLPIVGESEHDAKQN
jgi:putative PEP-CTERM system histidine kinase